MMAAKQVTVLNDDGCNTKLLPDDFVRRNRHLLTAVKKETTSHHSEKNKSQKSDMIVLNAEINLGSHFYESNWAVSNSQYDVFLGMPSNFERNPIFNYDDQSVMVDGQNLPLLSDRPKHITVSNIGEKKFRSFLRKTKHSNDIVVFHLLNITARSPGKSKPGTSEITNSPITSELKLKLDSTLTRFESVIQKELLDGLPPSGIVDHPIAGFLETAPPHRPLLQLSPSELFATMEYVTKLLKSGNIRPSRSPYGAPLFLSSKRTSSGVID